MKQISFKNLSLKYKISFAYSFAVALIFAVGGAILFSVMKHNIETGIENELKNTTSALMNMVRTSADISVKNYLRGIAEKNQDIVQNFYSQYKQGKLTEQEAKTKAGEILLTQTIGKTGYIVACDIRNAPGSVILVVHPKMQGTEASHFDFIKKMTQLKNGYMEYEWKNPDENVPRKKAMYLAYFEPWQWIIAVSSYREEFKDMVNVRDFRENVISHRFGKTGYAFVIGYEGLGLIHPYSQLEGKNFSDEKDARGRKFIAEMCMKKKGRIIYPWKNPGEVSARKKITVFNDIPEFGWIVGSSVYLDELYEPLNTVKNLILFTGFIAIFILFPIISMRISSYITNSLQLLMKKLALVSDRDFSVRMKICSEDEIEQMAGYFNNFMEQLEISAKKLSESEKKYRNIFENAVDGIFQSVPGGGYLSVNSAYAKILGYDSPEEVLSSVCDIGKQLYVNPEDREKLVEIIKENGMAEGFETQLYRKDKSIMWVSVYARSVSDNQGNLLYYEGSFVDITKRKDAENLLQIRTEELKESEEKYRTLFEKSDDAMLLIDNGKFVDCNAAAVKMLKYKNKYDLLETHPSELSPETQPDGMPSYEKAEKMMSAVVQKGCHRFEWMHRRADGEDFPVEVLLTLIPFRGKNFIHTVWRDITERKQAEQALKTSEKKFRVLFESAGDAIMLIDKGIIVDCNQKTLEFFEISKEQIIGNSPDSLSPDVQPDGENSGKKAAEKLNAAISGKPQLFEWLHVKTDGRPFNAEVSLNSVEMNNRNYVQAIIRDITWRKNTEKELEKYRKHLEETVEKRTAELKKALSEACIARKAAEEANKKITDSINYAKMIQRSLLANLDVVKTYLPDSFFIWEPRDIVGGDIFYTECFEDGFIVAVIDCTGHGVPGAFMTMIAVSALKRIVRDEGCRNPAEILKRLNVIVKTTLQQDKDYALSDDGMDAGIVWVTRTDIESPAFAARFSELTFAGARIPLYYVRSSGLTVIRGDKENIGYRRSDVNFDFTNHSVTVEKGMCFYMATDGFADQLGGDDRRRFGTSRLKNLLTEISGLPFEKQRSMLIQAFEEHRGENNRLDDMTAVGFGF